VVRVSGRIEWVKDRAVRNEPLDLAVLCRAAASICGIDRFGDDDWAALEGIAPAIAVRVRRDDYFGDRREGWFSGKDLFK
jgi:phage terminase large subunit GpA-like protein